MQVRIKNTMCFIGMNILFSFDFHRVFKTDKINSSMRTWVGKKEKKCELLCIETMFSLN